MCPLMILKSKIFWFLKCVNVFVTRSRFPIKHSRQPSAYPISTQMRWEAISRVETPACQWVGQRNWQIFSFILRVFFVSLHFEGLVWQAENVLIRRVENRRVLGKTSFSSWLLKTSFLSSRMTIHLCAVVKVERLRNYFSWMRVNRFHNATLLSVLFLTQQTSAQKNLCVFSDSQSFSVNSPRMNFTGNINFT